MKIFGGKIKKIIGLLWGSRSAAITIVLTNMIFISEALARAGGGGGGGGGGSSFGGSSYRSYSSYSSGGGSGEGSVVFTIGMAIFMLIWFGMWVHSIFKRHKNRWDSNRIISKLSNIDGSWNPKHIGQRLNKIYFAVQNAWMERDQDLAKEYMSQRLYDKHKEKTEIMKIKHEKNMLENIKLHSFKIISVRDYKDDDDDYLWVEIRGSMKDYTIDDRTGETIWSSGALPFEELWKLVRGETGWVLDDIDPNVTKEDYLGLQSSSDAI